MTAQQTPNGENSSNTAANAGAQSQTQLPIRRVGSISAGITLIIFGLALLGDMLFGNFIDLTWLFRFTPVLLIILGIEIIFSSRLSDKYTIKYDFASIIMCFGVIMFALFMTAASAYYILNINF